MGNTQDCNNSDYDNEIFLKIGEMTPIYPMVNDPNNYKKYNTTASKRKAMGSGIFSCLVTEGDEYLKSLDSIQIKEFEEHTVKAGTFSIYSQERCVGRLNYYKAPNVDTVDVCRTVDIILNNISLMDPTDGVRK